MVGGSEDILLLFCLDSVVYTRFLLVVCMRSEVE